MPSGPSSRPIPDSFQPPKRRTELGDVVDVDPHAAELQPMGDPHTALLVAPEHVRRQPVRARVRKSHHLVVRHRLVLEHHHRVVVVDGRFHEPLAS
jgi:hypothetical protein